MSTIADRIILFIVFNFLFLTFLGYFNFLHFSQSFPKEGAAWYKKNVEVQTARQSQSLIE